jgi:PAS domain S-box-containing protein
MASRSALAEPTGVWPAPHMDAHILVVDDSLGKRVAIRSIVEPLGHTVVEAESGEAALEAVVAQTFAVILMDVQMPDMNGYETAQLIRMRKQSEHTPVIFITAYDTEQADVPFAYASGAVDFIFAPIIPDVLRAKVSVFVELFLNSRDLELSLSDLTVLSDRWRDAEARTRAVLESVADGIVTVSDEGVIESFNRAASAMFHYTEEEAIGLPFSILVAPEQRSDFESFRDVALSAPAGRPKNDHMGESLGCRKDGSTFAMELDFSDLEIDARNSHVGCLRDVSQRRTYTDLLEHQTLHDPLTDLPNRVLFGDRVEQALRAAHRTEDPLALGETSSGCCPSDRRMWPGRRPSRGSYSRRSISRLSSWAT